MALGDDLLDQAKQKSNEKGKKRSFEDKQGYHKPWDAPPAHCADFVNGRSKLDDTGDSQFWAYISSETPILKWRTECPGVCRGVCCVCVCVCLCVCLCVCVCVRVCVCV